MSRYQPSPAETLAYENLALDHKYPWCWACGRGETEIPKWWHAPWMIQRAHIVNSPRIEATWAVVLLCPQCHLLAHGARIVRPDGKKHETAPLPRLSRANLLWLKQRLDCGDYRPELLSQCLVGRLPEPESPTAYFLTQYCQRHPECAKLLGV